MNMVSRGILSIIGISCISGIILFIIIQVEIDNQKRVWVEKYENHFPPFKGFPNWYSEKLKTFNNTIPESYDLKVEYLKAEGIIVYDFKREYKPELGQICEALGCRTGNIDSYLISKKDVAEFVRLGQP